MVNERAMNLDVLNGEFQQTYPFLQNGIVSQLYSLENIFPEINGWMYFPFP